MINKIIEPSIAKILELTNPATYQIRFPGHFLDGKNFEIKKGDRQYDFEAAVTPPKGRQNHKEIQFGTEDNVILERPGLKLFAPGKNIILNRITFNEEWTEKIFAGGISAVSTAPLSAFNAKYLRMIIPTSNQAGYNSNGFQGAFFNTPSKKSIHYIPLSVSLENYHLFQYKLGDDHYMLIDSIQPSSLNTFQKKCFNILLSLGFIKGSLIHDECFVIAFEGENLDNPQEVLYSAMRASVYSNQATFTSNPFSVHGDVDFDVDEKGMIKEEIRKKLYENMGLFPIEVFSALASLFYAEEKPQRAALLFIQGHVASLEMRIPNYYVALEAITGYVTSKVTTTRKSFSPIKDPKIASEIIQFFKEHALKLKTDRKLDDDDFSIKIIEKNIDKLNAPPNADKLSEPFTYFGYILSSEQKKILKDRNTFLHGSYLKTLDDDLAFRDGLHVGLRLHFMIAYLLLKLCGFNGKIINYAELWSHITGRSLGEERLVLI